MKSEKGDVGSKWKDDAESRNTTGEESIGLGQGESRFGRAWSLHNLEFFSKEKNEIVSRKVSIYLELGKKS